MKKSVLAVVASISAFLFASSDETLRAAWFVKDISCKVGTPLAGYGPNDISVEKLDDLQLHGLALDDGRTKTLLMSCATRNLRILCCCSVDARDGFIRSIRARLQSGSDGTDTRRRRGSVLWR